MLIGNGMLIDKVPLTRLGMHWNTQLQPGALPASTSSDNFGANAAMPDGYYTPQGWMLPRKAGAMAARNLLLATFDASGLAVGGITATGTSAITFTVADAAGQLISSGNGTASFAITAADLLLTASLNGVGSTSFAVTTNTALLGALASGDGSAAIQFTVPNVSILPVNDASPLREGAATITFSGSLTPYAIGIMVGTTAVASDIVNANIVSVNGYSVTGSGQTGSEWGPA